MGDVSVSKSTSSSSPEWTVTFLNNAGDLPLMTVDNSAMWGGVTVAVDEERRGTSEAVAGSFELGVSGNDTERVVVPYDVSAVEVNLTTDLKLTRRDFIGTYCHIHPHFHTAVVDREKCT